MKMHRILLLLLLAPSAAHASVGIPEGHYSDSWHFSDDSRIGSVTDFIQLLGNHPTDDKSREQIAEFLEGLGGNRTHYAMEQVRENDLLLSFLDVALRDEEGNAVAEKIYLAAMELMESREYDRFASTLASIPLNVYDPNEPGRTGIHHYSPDEFGGVLDFNLHALGSRSTVTAALIQGLGVAYGCQKGTEPEDICGVSQGTNQEMEAPVWTPVKERRTLDEARLAMLAGRHTAAVELLLAALEEDPSDPDPLLLLGDLARRDNQVELGRNYYRLALQLDPGLVDIAVWMSRSLIDAGKEPEALKILTSALAVQPDNLSLHLSKGHLQLEGGDPVGALENLREAAALAPRSFDAHRLLGLTWLELQRWAEAEHAYQTALSIHDDLQIHMELAQVYSESGVAPERALDHLQYVLEKDRGHVPALTASADLLLEQGRTQAAKGLWAEALRLDSSYCPALNNSGRLQLEQGRLSQAIAAYDQCLATQPDFKPALLNRGLAHGKLGQCAEAHRDLDPLIETGGDLKILANQLLGDCS